MNLLTKEETLDTAAKLTKSMKLRNDIEFSETSIRTPDIDFYEDEDQYFDPNIWSIHIGSLGITNRFEAKDEKDFEKALEFVQGHESQHVHSTASKPYSWAVQRGIEIIIEYIALEEDGIDKPERKFKRKVDYERYVKKLEANGIYISWDTLNRFMSGIANSVEDGRIEGIRAANYKGFATLRTFYRGIFWRQGADDRLQPYDDLNAGEKLRVICNQILFLSTCQLYQPGFFMTYAGTPMMDEVKVLIPYIARGVSAKTCREMAREVTGIAKEMAPLFYKACRLSKEDMDIKKALEKMLSDLIKSAIESDLNNVGVISENNEQKGNGELPSVFNNTDLEITLPDDVYDKLMENKEESDNNQGSGIKVKREHPKKEEEKEEENGSEESGSNESEGTSEGSESQENEGSDASGGKESEEKDSQEGSKASSSQRHANQESGNTSKSKADIDTSQNDKVMEEVEKAMKEAAEKTDAAAEKTINDINTSNMHESRENRRKESPDRSKPVSPEEMKDICSDFIEHKREYKVDQKMPAVLEARCRAMYRKNKRYFKSLSTPNVSHLDTGSVDPSLIYGLSFGDTEVFRKNGKDKKFDGCAYLLIDNSGSMSGNKRTEACKAAAVIEEGFKGLMPIKIVAFDEWGTVVHEVVKNWDENLNLNCCWNFCVHGRGGSGNEDGYDIRIATRELLKRPEQRKMLCVLSDGAPGDEDLVKEAVKEARKKGIEVYSIYFNEGSIGRDAETFKYMYEKDYVCCQLSEVDEHLSKLFKKFSRK